MTVEMIDRIYEASFVPELWPNILLNLAEATESKGGLLISTREKSLSWTASEKIYDDFETYLDEGWFRRCGRRVCLLEKAHSEFLREQDYWTEHELEHNEIYRDFFHPRGLGWSAGTGFVMPTGDHIVFSVERSLQRGPMESKHVNGLNQLRPHIARAAMVGARMGLQNATTSKEVFKKLSVPTILINLNGIGIECSDEVAALSDCIVWGVNNRISLKDKNADIQLQDALSARNATPEISSFAVRDENGLPVYVAHVIPVSRSAHDIFTKGYALLVLNPINVMAQPSIDLLRSLFDLTAAEANVARQLAHGNPVEEIASNGDVSINTVRTQIRKIIEKTGCKRLPEVVSMISNITLQH